MDVEMDGFEQMSVRATVSSDENDKAVLLEEEFQSLVIENKPIAVSIKESVLPAKQIVNNSISTGNSASITGKHSRLFDSEEQKRKMKEKEELKLKNEIKDCTFKPKINTLKLLTPNVSRRKMMDVSERLYKSVDVKRKTREKAEEQVREAEKDILTFKPKINRSSANRKEDSQRMIERLAKNKRELIEKLKQQKEEMELKECTFKPDLSNSRRLRKGRSGSVASSCCDSVMSQQPKVWERLARDSSLKEKEKKLKELKNDFEMKDCTFKPQISISVDGDSLNSEPVWERLSSKDQLLKQEKLEKMREDMELKECTFDARKTIENIRKQQKKETGEKVKTFLERVRKDKIIKAPLSSLDGGQSCFETAFKMIAMSASQMIAGGSSTYAQIQQGDLENQQFQIKSESPQPTEKKFQHNLSQAENVCPNSNEV